MLALWAGIDQHCMQVSQAADWVGQAATAAREHDANEVMHGRLKSNKTRRTRIVGRLARARRAETSGGAFVARLPFQLWLDPVSNF